PRRAPGRRRPHLRDLLSRADRPRSADVRQALLARGPRGRSRLHGLRSAVVGAAGRLPRRDRHRAHLRFGRRGRRVRRPVPGLLLPTAPERDRPGRRPPPDLLLDRDRSGRPPGAVRHRRRRDRRPAPGRDAGPGGDRRVRRRGVRARLRGGAAGGGRVRAAPGSAAQRRVRALLRGSAAVGAPPGAALGDARLPQRRDLRPPGALLHDRAAGSGLCAHGPLHRPLRAPHRSLRAAQPRPAADHPRGPGHRRAAGRHRDHRAHLRPARPRPAAAGCDLDRGLAGHRRDHARPLPAHRPGQPLRGPRPPAAGPPPRRRRALLAPADTPDHPDRPDLSGDTPMTSESLSRRGVLTATPIVLAAGALAACSSGGTSSGSGSDGGGEDSGGTLTIFSTGEEMSFDPATSQNLAITTLGLTARRLTAWKTSAEAPTELIPDLATDVGTPSDDGATWTFTLQEGLHFEDGTPITAATVKYGL